MTSSEPTFGGAIGRDYRESTPWWPEPTRPPAGAPNVVFLVLDDVGFGDLGCYGSEIETPVMDRLAAGGLRYTGFHTTAMCSPTRACLLTGRNSHSVGMGIIAEWSSGFPGYRGRVTRRAATLAEVLRDRGYSTLAVGKWHLMPITDSTAAGPFEHWPLGRGFDRWYGFHSAMTDHWHPDLYEDNHPVEPPARSGTVHPLATPTKGPADEAYHLTEDLVDRAIGMIRDQQSVAPEKPFFLYLGFGATHWPHHVPGAYIQKYQGVYDRGWDAIREERLARQKALGVVPPETELAPRNPDVRAWADLSPDEQRLFARMQEVYAGFLDHTDVQLGRLVAYLEGLGVLDNTLLVLLSDNGTSPEGGSTGSANGRKYYNQVPDTVAQALAALDDLGSDRTYPHYPTGWAQAGATPLKWYKKDVHGGGTRDPLILHWPARVRDAGGIRHQYHHVVDVMPTVLELLDVEAPASYRGVDQIPIQGVSMAYTIDQPAAPTRKEVQYYEMLGDRAIWHRGWKAVSRHERGTDFDADRWELYHLDSDFSECRDLAAERPEKLRELIERWWVEAGQYNVLPLDDRDSDRLRATLAARARKRYVYYPGMARVDRVSAPDTTNRSHSIRADLEIPAEGAAGILLSAGSRFGGYVLYVQESRPVYEYAYADGRTYRIHSDRPLPTGRPTTVRFDFARTGEHQGRGTLSIDGEVVGTTDLPETWRLTVVAGSVTCGREGGCPTSDAYTAPFPFTGTLHRVVVELDGDGAASTEGAYRAGLAEE